MLEFSVLSEWLAEAKQGQMPAQKLFPRLARHVAAMHVAVESPAESASGMLKFRPVSVEGDERELLVLFTDADLANLFLPGQPGHVARAEMLGVLQAAIRQGMGGLVINPGTHDLIYDARHLALLFREYALVHLQGKGGAWVSQQDGSMLAVELPHGGYTVPVYLTQEDAAEATARLSGNAAFRPWQAIRDRCQEIRAEAAFLQMGFAEQVGLVPQHLAQLGYAPESEPLVLLEYEVARSGGVANVAGVCRALAALEAVWVLVDPEGDLVALGKAVDLFTSAGKAENFVSALRAKMPQLPQLRPLRLPAPPLFRDLAKRRPEIAINRESTESWYGTGDVMPAVVGLLGA